MLVKRILLVLAAVLLVAGCGSDNSSDKSKKKEAKKKSSDPVMAAKEKSIDQSLEAVEKTPKDANAYRNLAQSYIAMASPTAMEGGKIQEAPKDRDKYLKKAVEALEEARKLDSKNLDYTQMLASTHLALQEYDEALPLLEEVAKGRKDDENAYYQLGLAYSNAGKLKETIEAWEMFVKLAGPKDPRVKQTKDSIKQLKAALKNPTPPPAPAPEDDKKSDKDK